MQKLDFTTTKLASPRRPKISALTRRILGEHQTQAIKEALQRG